MLADHNGFGGSDGLLVQLGRSQLDSTRTSSELRGEDVEPLEESDAERAKEVVATG